MPALHAMTDAETAHRLAIATAKWGFAPKDKGIDDDVLRTTVLGQTISNPIGLAAGFDKHGEAIDGLLDAGFGFVEIGSVTPKPQPGNPKPRYFRLLQDGAAINRYGFNSIGHDGVLANLRDRIRRFLFHNHSSPSPVPLSLVHADSPFDPPVTDSQIPHSLKDSKLLFVNLGKNKSSDPDSVDDYVIGVNRLGPYADAIVINVSSPNTPGLRGLMRRGMIEEVLSTVVKARDDLSKQRQKAVLERSNVVSDPPPETQTKTPILIKISPDLSKDEVVDIASAAIETGIEGIIVSNTTTSRPDHLVSATNVVSETGGLSGKPIKPLSLKAISTLAQHLHENNALSTPNDNGKGKIVLVGCGGVSSGNDVLDYARAGATLVEVYTAFGYEGIGLPRHLKDDVAKELKSQNKTWVDIIGQDIRNKVHPSVIERRALERAKRAEDRAIVPPSTDAFIQAKIAETKDSVTRAREATVSAVGDFTEQAKDKWNTALDTGVDAASQAADVSGKAAVDKTSEGIIATSEAVKSVSNEAVQRAKPVVDEKMAQSREFIDEQVQKGYQVAEKVQAHGQEAFDEAKANVKAGAASAKQSAEDLTATASRRTQQAKDFAVNKVPTEAERLSKQASAEARDWFGHAEQKAEDVKSKVEADASKAWNKASTAAKETADEMERGAREVSNVQPTDQDTRLSDNTTSEVDGFRQGARDASQTAQKWWGKTEQKAENWKEQAEDGAQDWWGRAKQTAEGMKVQAGADAEKLRKRVEGMKVQVEADIEQLRKKAEGMKYQAQADADAIRDRLRRKSSTEDSRLPNNESLKDKASGAMDKVESTASLIAEGTRKKVGDQKEK